MIGSLRGTLGEIEVGGDTTVDLTVEVGGVGYRVTVSARHAGSLGVIGDAVSVAIFTHVREGGITLYGFSDGTERRTFEQLIATHGVGPALAMAILGVLDPPGLARAVATRDLDALTRVPGVGRKTAERLVLELSQRLDQLAERTAAPFSGGDVVAYSEVREALSALGYGADEIRSALEGLPDQADVASLLRAALRELAPSR